MSMPTTYGAAGRPRPTRPRRSALIALIAVGLTIAGSISASTAVAASLPLTPPTIWFDHAATVRANGAAAVVTVHVACSGQPASSLELDVEQRRSDGSVAIAAGYAVMSHCGPHPQVVHAVLLGDYVTENSFGGNQLPLRTGSSQVNAYYYDCNASDCNEHYYAPSSVTLRYSAALDHRRSPAGELSTVGHVVEHGRAADIYYHATCSRTAGQTGIGDALADTTRGVVSFSSPNASDPEPDCSSGHPTWFRVRMYGVVSKGIAYVQFDDVHAVVTLR